MNPLIEFTAIEAGVYTAIVGGWSSFQSGDFTITSIASNSGGSGNVSADALVQSLIPEFEARFGLTFPITTVAAGQEVTNLITQLFANKHGSSPNAQSLLRLQSALIGVGDQGAGALSVPGYAGTLSAFVAAFALDNEFAEFAGVNLSRVLYYAIPTYPADEVPLAVLLTQLLDTDPTDTALADYAGMSQAEAFAAVLSLYGQQFPDAEPSWQPQGWVYYAWPYAYSISEERWHFFDASNAQWCVNLSNGEWATLAEATGWNYYSWPYSYSNDQSAWYWYDAGTQYVVDLVSGIWALFGD